MSPQNREPPEYSSEEEISRVSQDSFEYSVVEHASRIVDEQERYPLGIDKQKIIRKGQYLSVHKDTVSVFGWLEAHFLCQLDFYISKSKSKDKLEIEQRRRWVYKSHEQWRKELPCCSKSTLKRAIKKLEDIGVVLSNREPWKKGYSINYEAWAYFLHNPKASQKLSK